MDWLCDWAGVKRRKLGIRRVCRRFRLRTECARPAFSLNLGRLCTVEAVARRSTVSADAGTALCRSWNAIEYTLILRQWTESFSMCEKRSKDIRRREYVRL